MSKTKSLLIVCFFLSLAGICKAQFSIQASMPSVGLVQRNQLWDVMIINSSGVITDCKLDIIVRDRIDGQEIFTASSNQFTIAQGTKQLNAQVLNPIQYNYLMPGINTAFQGLMPVGSYTVCYVLNSVPVKETSLAEECIAFETEPLSPPMLTTPSDSSVLDMPPTQFNWVPPTPAGMFNQLQYEILITEVQPQQNATEALQSNIPFYNESGHIANSLNYPTSALSFEEDKWYAWQIVARDERTYSGKSETWVFKVNKSIKPVSESPGISYLELKNEQNEHIHIITDDTIRLKYYSFDKSKETDIKFFGNDGNLIDKVKYKIQYGNNYIQLRLNTRFRKENIYRVVVTDSKGKDYMSIFSIQ